jgi:hypothetical protein
MGAFAVNSGLFPHPPEQQNYVDQYAKLAQLRNALAMAPLQRQEAQQQIQAGQLDIQQKQQALNDQQAATKAMQEWDGQNFMELPGLVLKHGGSAQSVLSMKSGILQQQEAMTKLSTDQLSNEKTKNDYIAGHIANVQALPPEQQADGFKSAVQDLVGKNYITPQQAQGLQYQGPQQLDYLKKTYQGLTAMQEEALKKAQTGEATGKEAASEAEAAKNQSETKALSQIGMAPGVPVEAVAMADWLKKNPGKGASDFLAWKAKQAPLAQIQVANAAGGGMSSDAIDQAAEYYHSTGKLPPGGRGVAGLAQNRAIMNRAAILYPGSMTEGTAEFSANKSSLQGLQKQFDQVTAFENTAGKNLDVFLNTAKGVIDSGSPLINAPLRNAAALAGSGNQAAFSAARTTALTEIAKVLNSSNASGVLSDSARHEVEGLIGPNASLKQIYDAANILKQDMANRHESYQQQIKDIQGRIGGKPAQPQNGSGGTQGGGAKAETRTYQGHTYEKQPDGSWKLQ